MTTAAMDIGKQPFSAREIHEQAVELQEEHAAHERGLGNEASARRAHDLADRARERLHRLLARPPRS
jgi:hypothetical protein